MDSIFKILNSLIPKSLIARFTLIICMPMITCQLIAVYLFYERHWHNVSMQTSKILANQIEFLKGEIETGDLTQAVKYSRLVGFSFEQLKNAPDIISSSYKLELDIFRDVLKKTIRGFAGISHNNSQTKINIYIATNKDKILKITIPSKPLVNPTSEIFVYWIIGISALFLTVALLFAKNQIRSIEELSNAANNFGKSLSEWSNFKPTGATEIRRAGFAIIKMQERLEKQVQKRMQMLAMISHDLRTPLTRMFLQLVLLEETPENKLLKSDVESMKHMIDSYLDFARGEEAEKAELVEINLWLKDFFEHSRFRNTELILGEEKLYAYIKPLSFMRALTNIISNAEKYSSHAEFSCKANENNIVFSLEDNGPGIKEEEKHLVFKAFYRSDKARRIDKAGSVGLGLPIAKEIIIGHKGAIIILDSKKLGGAKIVVTIPKEVGDNKEIANE